MSFDQLRVVGRGLLIWDSGAFLCLLDDFCHRPTSLCVAHQRPTLFSSLLQEGEAGSCRASHSGWGSGFDSPPPSSPVFSNAQNTGQDCLASVWPPETCTSAAILVCSPHLPSSRGSGVGGGAGVSRADEKQGGLRTFLYPRVEGRAIPTRPEEQAQWLQTWLPKVDRPGT